MKKIKCPVLVIFSEDDALVPVVKSMVQYVLYLRMAGNEDYTIKVFPEANHVIKVGSGFEGENLHSGEFAPKYFELISGWLISRIIDSHT